MNHQKNELEKFNQDFIRNISIISHVDHGKTTLSDYLLASGGLIPEYLAGSLKALDSLPEEQRRGITIDTSLATYLLDFENNKYLINLIDTPGHVDFSGKVAESLRLVDGSLIIVDAVEGIMAQTKSVLKQAIKEKIIFILFINKIDRLIKELELNSLQIQKRIQKIISNIMTICINNNIFKANIPNFTNGTVLLGSAMDGWAIDINYVNKGNTISDIISMYDNSKLLFSNELKLSNTVNRAIVNHFPSPISGQINKFPALLRNEHSEKIIQLLTACNPKSSPIIIIGRQERTSINLKNSYIARILSGTIRKGMTLNSTISNKSIKIIRISQLHGRSKINSIELKSGYIASIVFSEHLISGDILTLKDIGKIVLNDISYIQDPVVAIGIEPLQIKQISKLQRVIKDITEYTPGLYYELNKVTGELIVLGVGTLQLDVFVKDLKALKYSIEVSPPLVISYEIPLLDIDTVNKELKIKYLAGKDNIITNKCFAAYEDDQNNKLLLKNSINSDGLDGITEVFRQSMSISPHSGKKIKGFSLLIINDENDIRLNTYENAMIIGSKLIKESLIKTKSTVHEPYYDMEIILPEKYIGEILQELQRMKSIIIDVISKEDDSVIVALISVKEAIFMADKLRQISDGNAFWSFPAVKFLPVS